MVNNLLGPACCDETECFWGPQDLDISLNTPYGSFFGEYGQRLNDLLPEQERAVFNNGAVIPWGIINDYWNSRNYGPHKLNRYSQGNGPEDHTPVNFQAWTGPPDTLGDDPGYSFACVRHKCQVNPDPSGGSVAGGLVTIEPASGSGPQGYGPTTPYTSPIVQASWDPDFKYSYNWSGAWSLPILDSNAPTPPPFSRSGQEAIIRISSASLPSIELRLRQFQDGTWAGQGGLSNAMNIQFAPFYFTPIQTGTFSISFDLELIHGGYDPLTQEEFTFDKWQVLNWQLLVAGQSLPYYPSGWMGHGIDYGNPPDNARCYSDSIQSALMFAWNPMTAGYISGTGFTWTKERVLDG